MLWHLYPGPLCQRKASSSSETQPVSVCCAAPQARTCRGRIVSCGCIPIPWLHPIPAELSKPPCCKPFASCLRHELAQPPGTAGVPGALPVPAFPAPVPNRLSSLPPFRAAEPGLQCHPLQEHFRHVPRWLTSSPHLGHGAHHPPATGPLCHQLFHFTQCGAHPQEKLGEVLHPNIFR